jgi:hypothetical protein
MACPIFDVIASNYNITVFRSKFYLIIIFILSTSRHFLKKYLEHKTTIKLRLDGNFDFKSERDVKYTGLTFIQARAVGNLKAFASGEVPVFSE